MNPPLKRFVILLLLCSAATVFAQTNAQIEKELIASLQEIEKYSNYGDNYDEQKLSQAQDTFQEKLLKYSKIPATLQFEFNELNKNMYNATSKDGKFRIYSWDLEDGGSMHNFARIYQYQGEDGKVYSEYEDQSKEDAEPSFVTDIFMVKTDQAPIYVVCSTLIASNSFQHQYADLFRIEGSTLDKKVNLIKTKSGFTNALTFSYDFFSVVDRPERPIRLITFDEKTQTLSIPVVIEDEKFRDGRVTNRMISYRFSGTYFEKQ